MSQNMNNTLKDMEKNQIKKFSINMKVKKNKKDNT